MWRIYTYYRHRASAMVSEVHDVLATTPDSPATINRMAMRSAFVVVGVMHAVRDSDGGAKA